ncbi:MAG: diphthine--ammonia ligase [Acidilobaceae archaeon]
MRVCALLSGGKDSNYALYKAILGGSQVSCIIVVESGREDSWMFHTINTHIALLQSEAMGFSDRTYTIRVSGFKEREVEELLEGLLRIRDRVDFDTIVAGAIASIYQKSRIDSIAKRLNIKIYTPAWGLNQEEYMRAIIREGFKYIITSITVMGLPYKLLGVPIGLEEVEEIIRLSRKYGFNPSFEGGEAETLVYDAPHYRKTICFKGRKVKIREFDYRVIIENAWLGSKGENCQEIIDDWH